MKSGNVSDGSDTSDEDYVPDGKAEEQVSEEDSDGEPEDDLPATENTAKRSKGKQGKKSTKRRKKSKKLVAPDTEAIPDEESEMPKSDASSELTEEDKKKKEDSLWADFLSDTNFKPKPKPTVAEKTLKNEPTKKIVEVRPKPVEQPKKVTVTQIFEFAGEEVKVTKEVAADSAEARLLPNKDKPSSSDSQSAPKPSFGKSKGGLGGIGSVLSQLGKKQKISTLEKSKLDWDSFKKDEKIEEELEKHNKGKDGYLDRQDFLERADLRRFEIEKEIRSTQRSHRLT